MSRRTLNTVAAIETWQAQDHAVRGQVVAHRLTLATAQSAAADAKAGQLLAATSLLLTAGGVLTGTLSPAGVAAGLAGVAGVACTAALLALLGVVRVRGGDVTAWLLPPFPSPASELLTVVRIVTRKHHYLRAAHYTLTTAVLTGTASVAITVLTAGGQR